MSQLYTWSVFIKGADVGTYVTRITADDPDTTANIVYSIQPDSITAKNKGGNPVVDTSVYDFVVRPIV